MSILSLEESRTYSEWLRLLAQPQRLIILLLLMEDSHTVSMIETRTTIGQPKLSQHLGTLRRTGLIESRRESRTIRYELPDTPEAARIRALLHLLRHGTIIPAIPPRRKKSSSAEGARFAWIFPTIRNQ